MEVLFNLIADGFDLVALAFVVFAGLQLLRHYFKLPKVKGSYSLSDRDYHVVRSHFVHRVILAIDFFLASDLIALAFAASEKALIQILLIVVIRTVLSYFLNKEIEERRQ